MGGLRDSVFEAGHLLRQTGRVWLALWPALIGLMLVGWVGYYGSVLLGATLGHQVAYLVIPSLALGVVIQLATILLGLRLVGSHLGVGELIQQTAGVEAAEQAGDSFSHVLAVSLLPFLGVYAAFGFVDEYATDLLLLANYRYGWGTILPDLNPAGSTTAMLVTLGAVVALYVVRRLLDSLRERTGWRSLGVLAVFLEACLLFVVLLSAFRIFEQIGLWWGDREAARWLGLPGVWLAGLLEQLPAFVTESVAWIGEVVWPALWDNITQPLAWLTMAALAFGSRVLSLADLWENRRNRAGTDSAPQPDAVPASRTRAGLSRVLKEAQEAFLGDVNDKYLPTWQSLKLVVRAGLPFLASYVVLFTALRVGGIALEDLLAGLMGGQETAVWMKLDPFFGLIGKVAVFSLQVALLGAAYTRMLELFAARSEGRETARQGASFGSRVVPAALVGASCLVLMVAVSILSPAPGENVVRRARTGEAAALQGTTVTVGEPTTAERLVVGQEPAIDGHQVFVVVPVSFYRPGADGAAISLELVSGDRSYPAWPSVTSRLRARPGFEATGDFVFELDRADLGTATLQVTPFTDLIQGQLTVIEVPVDLAEPAAGSVALAQQYPTEVAP